MFRNTFQSGFISILSPGGSHPLQLWDIHLEDDGEIRLIKGNDANRDESNHISNPVIEMTCSDPSQNYIICPFKLDSSTERPSLGITLPILYLTIYMPEQQQRNNDHFSVEVSILDEKQITRRFRCSTFQSTTSVQSDVCICPLRLTQRPRGLKREQLLLPPIERDNLQQEDEHEECEPCWNRVCIPLAEYTYKAYGTKLLETRDIRIQGQHVYIDRVYFTEKQFSEDELPQEFRLFQ